MVKRLSVLFLLVCFCLHGGTWTMFPWCVSGGTITPCVASSTVSIGPTVASSGGTVAASYLFSDAQYLTHWYAATKTGSANVAFIGDSITEGFYATNHATTSFVGQLKALFASKYGSSTYNFVPAWSNLFTDTGVWTTGEGYSQGANYATSSATRQISVTGDTLDVYYVVNTGNSAAFTITVDGGAPISMGGESGSLLNIKQTVALGTNAAHTILLTAPSSLNVFFQGYRVSVTGAAGIAVYNLGRQTTAAINYSTAEYAGMLDLVPMDLAVIGLTTNDYNNQTALTDYKTYMQNLITHAKAGGSQSCLIVGMPRIQDQTKTIAEQDYIGTVAGLAAINGCAFIDIAAAYRWKDWIIANNVGYMYDALHPNDMGHADIAAILGPLLAP